MQKKYFPKLTPNLKKILFVNEPETDDQRFHRFLIIFSFLQASSYTVGWLFDLVFFFLFGGPVFTDIAIGVGIAYPLQCLIWLVSRRRKTGQATLKICAWSLIFLSMFVALALGFLYGIQEPMLAEAFIITTMSLFLLPLYGIVLVALLGCVWIAGVYALAIANVPPFFILDTTIANSVALGLWVILLLDFTAIAVYLASQLRSSNRLALAKNAELLVKLDELQNSQLTGERVAHNLLSGSTVLLQNSVQQKEALNLQLETYSEVGSTLTELTYAAQSIADNALAIDNNVGSIARASTIVQQTTGNALNASEIGVRAVENLEVLNSDAVQFYYSFKEHLTDLSLLNEQLQAVAKNIMNISHQTHLLSLNASIEAAGAGEYGDRFAVVASAVKDLATTTTNSSRNAVAIIEKVQSVITESVNRTVEGQQITEQTRNATVQTRQSIANLSQVVAECSEQMQAIGQQIKQLNETTNQIRAATTQEYQVINHTKTKIEDLNVVAGSTATHTQEIQVLAEALQDSAAQLDKVLSISSTVS